MPEELAPPVVAVVVSHDPGPWLEECLRSLHAQDYPGLTVLVIDQASEPPLAERIAAVTPDFYLRRLETNVGFGPGANAVRGVVEGASHFVFCHDDVVLARDAIRQMVEEAFRRNAGIIGPKLVDPDDVERILQLGLGVDRFGAPVPRVERLEFDQAQHDEVQEAFAVPGGCILVRADLFEALGGFDDQISMFGEDVDLCWRARIAGARAFVVPQAVVRHYEATASRRRERPDARALQWRHELRAVLKNYSRLRRTMILVDLALLSVIEISYFYAVNRPQRAHQVIDAWRWNYKPERRLKEARAAVESTRIVSDFELRSLFSNRTSRAWRFTQGRVEELLTSSWSRENRANVTLERDVAGSSRTRAERYVIAIAVLVLLIGSRSLLVGHLPLMGGYLPLPSPTALLRDFFGGVPSDGIGRIVPGSPALLLLGLAGFVTFGSMGLLLKVLLVGSIVLGAVGIARLLRPFGNSMARLVGVIAYLFVPLCWNDVARGDVLALVAFAAAPFVISRLLRATGIAPFTSTRAPQSRIGLVREVLPFSLLLALLGSFVPIAAIFTPVLALALGIGCAAFGAWRAGLRALLVSLAALLGAAALTFPWSLSFFEPGASLNAVFGTLPSPGLSPQLGAVLRFELGPFGAGILGLALFAAAFFPLLVTLGDRFKLAAVLWIQLLAAALIVWAASEGWLDHTGGLIRDLAPAFAALVAVEIALGVAVVKDEIARSRFGWRHILSLIFVAVVAAGILPILGESLSGRYDVPATGDEAVLDWIQPPSSHELQRVFYLGSAVAVPGSSFGVSGNVAGLITSPGLPEFPALLPGGNVRAVAGVVDAVNDAESGLTIRLGASLAAYGIRYIVVPTSAAPMLQQSNATPPAPPPEILLAALSAQSDLHELPSEAGVLIFENTAWTGRGERFSGGTPAWLRSSLIGLELALVLGCLRWLLLERRRRRARARDARAVAHLEPAEMVELSVVGQGVPV
jgi:GT2 family glycosyltransferase